MMVTLVWEGRGGGQGVSGGGVGGHHPCQKKFSTDLATAH